MTKDVVKSLQINNIQLVKHLIKSESDINSKLENYINACLDHRGINQDFISKLQIFENKTGKYIDKLRKITIQKL